MGMFTKSTTTMRRTVAAKRSTSSHPSGTVKTDQNGSDLFLRARFHHILMVNTRVIMVGIPQAYLQTLSLSSATENLSSSMPDGQCWVRWDALLQNYYQNIVDSHSVKLYGLKQDRKSSKKVA